MNFRNVFLLTEDAASQRNAAQNLIIRFLKNQCRNISNFEDSQYKTWASEYIERYLKLLSPFAQNRVTKNNAHLPEIVKLAQNYYSRQWTILPDDTKELFSRYVNVS